MSLEQMTRIFKERSPEILTGVSITGFFASLFMMNKASIRASQLIEERKLDEGRDELTVKEKIQTTWRVYTPVAITAMGATACAIGAATQNYKRNAALAAAYGLSQETLNIYRQKVIETIGEKRESEVREETDKEIIKNHPPKGGFEVNPVPPDTLCCYKGRYFYGNWDSIRSIVNQLGEDMLNSPHDPSVTENDFFEMVGLGFTTEGNRLGWNLHINGRPELCTPSLIELENHQIVLVISFYNEPIDIYNTRKLR